MSDLISTQESVAKIVDTAIRKISCGEQKLTKEYEQSVKEAVNVILDTARRERGKAEALAEIIHCGECKYYDDSDGCFFSTATTGADGSVTGQSGRK